VVLVQTQARSHNIAAHVDAGRRVRAWHGIQVYSCSDSTTTPPAGFGIGFIEHV
jgi:hypothetical protein